MPITSYRDLVVWQRSMLLTERIYALSRAFPRDERFGLSSQMRRAAVSIPSNIAEGWSYGTTGRYIQHLRIGLGSNAELQTQLMLAERVGIVRRDEVEQLVDESFQIGKMLNGLINSLRPAP